MIEQEIENYNRLCAEFLGWKYSQNYELFYEIDNIWEEKTDGVWYKESDRVENPKDYELYYVKVNGFCLKDYNYTLKFHLDWNWIHEVKKKIQELPRVFFHVRTGGLLFKHITVVEIYKYAESKETEDFEYLKKDFYECEEKEAVVQAINQFLIWYNDNSK